jgi:hypothetical protein
MIEKAWYNGDIGMRSAFPRVIAAAKSGGLAEKK